MAWIAIVLGVLGVAKIVQAQYAQAGPPVPPASADRTLPSSVGTRLSAVANLTGLAPLGYSVPIRIDIPAVGIDADLISVGLADDGTIGVPPLNQARKAGWFDQGPAPGQPGAAVIDAHVDSRETAGFRGAFYALGDVRPGQQVRITRTDHAVAVFTVDSVEMVPKTHFPTSEVYGSVYYPALRLITCGGGFDQREHSYLDNIIVYAHLTGTQQS
jgi:hypothetical protein